MDRSVTCSPPSVSFLKAGKFRSASQPSASRGASNKFLTSVMVGPPLQYARYSAVEPERARAFVACLREKRYFRRFDENSRIAFGLTIEPRVSLIEKCTGVSPI